MQHRRVGGRYSNGGSSPVENGNGHHHQPTGGQLCPGESVCIGINGGSNDSSSSNGAMLCGGCSARKSSPLRRAITTLRIRARRAASGSQKGPVGAYLAACVFLVWCGLQATALLRGGGAWGSAAGVGEASVGGGGGQQQQPPPQRELTAAGRDAAAAPAVAGYGKDDVGPRLAYGIMVYQRVGYSPQMTLDQFARMFNALYDPENT